MSKVAIVTDSTAYIPDGLKKNYSITFVPLQIIWGDETFLDLVDIQPVEFYERLKHAKVMPTTSQPSPAAFIDVYRGLLDQGYDIISAHISSKLSGTLDSALQARQHFPGARIEVIDSQTTSMALSFSTLATAKAAAQGATLSECKALLEKGCANSGILFAVATLEFLRRGGRIGGAQAFLGTALNLKPILELKNGRVEAIERVRTMSKTIDRLLDLFEERIGGRQPVSIAAMHASAPEEARILLERAQQRFSPGAISEAVITEVSPVVGAHTGPGTMALAYMTGI